MNEYVIAAIPPEVLDLAWPEAAPFIKLATDISHNEATVETVRKRVYEGSAILLVVYKEGKIIAAITGEVREFDTGVRALFWPIVGGREMDLWFEPMYEAMLTVAKSAGCTEMRGIAVRNGWLKRLKNYGWEEVSISVRCPIEQE
jgi:hypothetical protein